MRGFLKRHTETVVVAFVVAAVTAGAPAIAAVVQNAHHAHIADIAKNARRLGGVSPSGYYKTSDTVAEATHAANADHALNSDQLGGVAASSYALKTDVPGSIWALIKPGTSPAVMAGSGVSGVTHHATGVYCLTLSATPPTGAVGLASVEFSLSSTADQASDMLAEVDSKPGTGGAGCASGQLAVRTFVSQSPSGLPPSNNAVAADDGVAFVFTIT
jgi:hypothetical protein